MQYTNANNRNQEQLVKKERKCTVLSDEIIVLRTSTKAVEEKLREELNAMMEQQRATNSRSINEHQEVLRSKERELHALALQLETVNMVCTRTTKEKDHLRKEKEKQEEQHHHHMDEFHRLQNTHAKEKEKHSEEKRTFTFVKHALEELQQQHEQQTQQQHQVILLL